MVEKVELGKYEILYPSKITDTEADMSIKFRDWTLHNNQIVFWIGSRTSTKTGTIRDPPQELVDKFKELRDEVVNELKAKLEEMEEERE